MKKNLLTYLSFFCFITTIISQTTFSTKMNITNSTGEDPFFVVSGDLDNDTDNDILICTSNLDASALVLDTIEWYKNDGTGVFTVQTLVSSTLKQVSGLQIVDLDNPQYGTAVVVGNSIKYTPNDGYTGTDSFWYGIKDASGYETSALVEVYINESTGCKTDCGPAPITVKDDSASTDQGVGMTINVLAIGRVRH